MSIFRYWYYYSTWADFPKKISVFLGGLTRGKRQYLYIEDNGFLDIECMFN
jgi:hypothetical protein